MENFQPTMGLQTLIRSIALLALEPPRHSWPLGFARQNKPLYTVATYSDMGMSLALPKPEAMPFTSISAALLLIYSLSIMYLSLIITYLASTAISVISSASYSWLVLNVILLKLSNWDPNRDAASPAGGTSRLPSPGPDNSEQSSISKCRECNALT